MLLNVAPTSASTEGSVTRILVDQVAPASVEEA